MHRSMMRVGALLLGLFVIPTLAVAQTAEAPKDLISMSAVPFKGSLTNARATRLFTARFTGVRADQIVAQPPMQRVEDDTVTVDMPMLIEIPTTPISALPADFEPGDEPPPFLGSSPTLPVGHLDIQRASEDVVAGATNRL